MITLLIHYRNQNQPVVTDQEFKSLTDELDDLVPCSLSQDAPPTAPPTLMMFSPSAEPSSSATRPRTRPATTTASNISTKPSHTSPSNTSKQTVLFSSRSSSLKQLPILSSDGGFVDCPLCGHSVSGMFINSHIDSGCRVGVCLNFLSLMC